MRFDEFYEKAQALIETPYQWEGNYDAGSREFGLGDRMSNRQLEATYSYMGEVSSDVTKDKLKLYSTSGGGKIQIVGFTPIGDKYNDSVFAILLKETKVPSVGNVYEVSNVQVIPEFRMHGFATAVYAYLVKEMGIVISDKYQYEGAVALWKAMAKKVHSIGLKVVVINMKTQEQTEYDGSNIPDDVIWGTDLNYHTNMRLLLMPK